MRVQRLHPLFFRLLYPVLPTLQFFQQFVVRARFLRGRLGLNFSQLWSLGLYGGHLRMFHSCPPEAFIASIGRIAQTILRGERWMSYGPVTGGTWFERRGANVGSPRQGWGVAVIVRFWRSRRTLRQAVSTSHGCLSVERKKSSKCIRKVYINHHNNIKGL